MSLLRLTWDSWARGGWINQGEKEAVLNLPPGKVYSHVPRQVATTEADLIARGFQYFFEVAGGSTDPAHRVVLYEATQVRNYAVTRLGGKIALQWSRDEVRAFIFTLYPFGITTDSMDEGYYNQQQDIHYENYTFPTGSDQRAWANEALAELARQVTPNAILIASYADKFLAGQDLFFNPSSSGNGSVPRSPNTPAARAALATQEAARAGIDFYTKGVSNTARANMTIYPGTGLRNVNGGWSNYIIPYNMMRLAKASGPDLLPLGFTWVSLEQGGYNGSYAWRHEMANGTLWQNDEIYWSHNKAYHATASTLLWGGGNILWNRPDRFLTDPEKVNYQPNNIPGEVDVHDVWQGRNGAAPPARSAPRYFPMRSESINDAHLAAAVDYGKLAAAAGTNFQFRRYRVDKGQGYSAWYEVPSDVPSAAILEAAEEMRGICTAAVTGNDIGVYYQDPGNPTTGQQVQADLGGGRIITFDCYGQEPVRLRGSMVANTTQTLSR